jgi:hypothetical protein
VSAAWPRELGNELVIANGGTVMAAMAEAEKEGQMQPNTSSPATMKASTR